MKRALQTGLVPVGILLLWAIPRLSPLVLSQGTSAQAPLA
jgi:hypothetical protein